MIEILYSRQTNNLSVQQMNVDPNGCELLIGIEKENPKESIKLKDLKLEYQLKQLDSVLSEKKVPNSVFKPISSNQKYLISDVLNLEPDQSYTLVVKMELNGCSCEMEIGVETPELVVESNIDLDNLRN